MTKSTSVLTGLVPWQHRVSGGFTMRGHYTPPTGKPVMHFIHGNGFNGLVYERFLAPFLEHFDLFLSNAQGHGDSDPGVAFTDWDDSAAYFSEVWQHYSALWSGVEKIGLGHSFGAVNTLLMSDSSPPLFDRLIMLDPIIGTKAWTFLANGLNAMGLSRHLPLAKQARARGVEWNSDGAAWHYFYQRGTFKGWEDECLRSYIDHALSRAEDGSLSLKCPPHIEAAIFASYSKGVWRAFDATTLPIDILFGDRTYDFVRNNLPRIARDYDHVTTHEVAGGHCFMFEQPVLSAKRVLQVLSAS